MRKYPIAAVTALLIGGVACGGSGGDGGGGTGPSGPAEIAVKISIPAGNTDGVVLVRISGDAIPAVVNRGFQLRAVGVGTSTVHIIARGSLQGSIAIAALCIPRIQDVAAYSVTVIQAAAGQGGGYAKRNTVAYSAMLDQSTIAARQSC